MVARHYGINAVDITRLPSVEWHECPLRRRIRGRKF
jgi:hypothetical protein